MTDESIGYIIPFAKRRGETSFSSLKTLKRLLKTQKVGHTGTLDAFADGLLVALSGKLTRIASFIEAKTKIYEAEIVFGVETDTLDIFGKPIFSTSLPLYKDLPVALSKFIGNIMQVPPQYSALHVGGRRAYEVARGGESVELLPRPVFIEEIKVMGVLFADSSVFVETAVAEQKKDGKVGALHTKIRCSKGTYIRSLARDIGKELSSCAHLRALRRVVVGNFSLEKAFGYELLPHFLSDDVSKEEYEGNIEDYLLTFSIEVCRSLNLFYLNLKEEFKTSFLQGKKIRDFWFYDLSEKKINLLKEGQAFVFCESKILGAIKVLDGIYRYRFVF